MPIPVGTWIEKFDSRDGKVTAQGANLTRKWVVINGGSDESDIFQSACYWNPPIFDRLIRQEVHQTPLGGGVWNVDVEYGNLQAANGEGAATGNDEVTDPPEPDADQPLGPGYSFDTTGQTVHVTQSILTRSKTKRGGGTARDYKQAIGVTRDRVEGVDIFAPKLEFTIALQANRVTLNDVKKIKAATGKINKDPWLGFGKEDVLYMGGSGSFSGGPNDKWTITHKFAFAETENNVTVCSGLTIPQKRGWDYVWFTYEEAADGTNGIVSLPLEAYVEQVYNTTDFTTIIPAL